MKLIAKKDFFIGNRFFAQGEEVKVENFEEVTRINEKGFIEPLTVKELMEIREEIKNGQN